MGESLLNSEITTMISGFAGDVVPTVISLVGILVPVGLTLWGIGFGVKKALGFIQSKANGAV